MDAPTILYTLPSSSAQNSFVGAIDKSLVKITPRGAVKCAAQACPKIYHEYLLSKVDSAVIIAAVYFAIKLRSD